jgi:hypothetical protein
MLNPRDLKAGETLLDHRDGMIWLVGGIESCGDHCTITAFRTRGFFREDVKHLELVAPGSADRPTVIDDVLREVNRAIKKFPTWPSDPMHALAVLGEEFGELTKEAVQLTYEPHKTSAASFREEAIQTAAMALRFVMSLDNYTFAGSEQHRQLIGPTEPKCDDDGGA